MTTPVRTFSIVLLVAAVALAVVASIGASADETSNRFSHDRAGMMTNAADRPMMGRGDRMDRHGAFDSEQMREHRRTMMGDDQMREGHRDMRGQDNHHGGSPMHDDAQLERMRADCDHGDGLERARGRAKLSRTTAS